MIGLSWLFYLSPFFFLWLSIIIIILFIRILCLPNVYLMIVRLLMCCIDFIGCFLLGIFCWLSIITIILFIVWYKCIEISNKIILCYDFLFFDWGWKIQPYVCVFSPLFARIIIHQWLELHLRFSGRLETL